MRFVKILFSLLFAVAVIFSFYIKLSTDTDYNAPEFKCDAEVINASVNDSDEKLLSYVSAFDEKDGDLTSEIIIESVSPFVGPGNAVITYAVCDSDSNVSKLEKEIFFEDYTYPEFSFEKQHMFYVGATKIDLISGVKAADCLDGDITQRVVIVDSQLDTSQSGVYPVTYRVTTSKGITSEIQINAYVYDSKFSDTITLSRYLVYADSKNKVVPMDYVEEYPEEYFSDSRNGNYEYTFDITDNIDYSKPGIYYVTYKIIRTERYNEENTVVLSEAYLAVAVRGES